MKAEISIQTEAATFNPGTIAGDWQWIVHEEGTPPIGIRTAEPDLIFDVEPGTNYTVTAQRLDAEGFITLGGKAEVSFKTAELTVINVAGSLDVSVS